MLFTLRLSQSDSNCKRAGRRNACNYKSTNRFCLCETYSHLFRSKDKRASTCMQIGDEISLIPLRSELWTNEFLYYFNHDTLSSCGIKSLMISRSRCLSCRIHFPWERERWADSSLDESKQSGKKAGVEEEAENKTHARQHAKAIWKLNLNCAEKRREERKRYAFEINFISLFFFCSFREHRTYSLLANDDKSALDCLPREEEQATMEIPFWTMMFLQQQQRLHSALKRSTNICSGSESLPLIINSTTSPSSFEGEN